MVALNLCVPPGAVDYKTSTDSEVLRAAFMILTPRVSLSGEDRDERENFFGAAF